MSATAGAHLDLAQLALLWPVALILCGVRAATTWGAGRLAAHVSREPPLIRSLGFTGLVSQAGVTLGMSAAIAKAFPALGGPFRALAVACVALNEIAGPILFKAALERAGEVSTSADRMRPSSPDADPT
jgi:hypothetical protein